MPRYQFSEGTSNKFWEIDLSGKSFTTTWGKIGTKGQSAKKSFASPAAAQKEHDKLVAEKTGKGYTLIGGQAKKPPAAAAPAKHNPELEKAIEADPDDEAAYLVYADWLQAQGDPRGELIALQAAGKDTKKKVAAFLTGIEDMAKTHDRDKKPGFTWRWGFIQKLRVAHDYFSHDDEAGQKYVLAEALARALAHPSLRFLTELEVGLNRPDGESVYQDVVDVLAKKGPTTLRALHLADFEYPHGIEMSWTHLGKLGKLWPRFPQLRELIVQGGDFELGAIKLPELRSASFRTGGLKKKSLAAITDAEWPKIEELEIWFGEDEYGSDIQVKHVAPLLAAKLPALRSLGLMNAPFTNELVAMVAGSKLLKQLTSLDLSMGTMSDEGAAELVAHRAAFAHLEELDVSDNFLSRKAIKSLSGVAKKVVAKEQREADEYDDEIHRYVSVGE
jgi:uncharacterized protein (TIGR02996 family)